MTLGESFRELNTICKRMYYRPIRLPLVSQYLGECIAKHNTLDQNIIKEQKYNPYIQDSLKTTLEYTK